MKPKPNPKDHWRDLCANLSEDDGVPLDDLKKQEAKPKADRGGDRSTRRLCANAMRTIHISLLADCHDSDLQSLEVQTVEPYPDAKRLLVTLVPTQRRDDLQPLQYKVQAVAHLLRHAVARSMSRKRTPQLCFVVVPRKEAHDEA
ncbi:MAG: hypothetical protein KTR15_01465 [Phycisphaeraceae bacterium]|nr:hypothetical protein [Phycisphaeraceae bacterium]